jgi:hypothetical protein
MHGLRAYQSLLLEHKTWSNEEAADNSEDNSNNLGWYQSLPNTASNYELWVSNRQLTVLQRQKRLQQQQTLSPLLMLQKTWCKGRSIVRNGLRRTVHLASWYSLRPV